MKLDEKAIRHNIKLFLNEEYLYLCIVVNLTTHNEEKEDYHGLMSFYANE